MTGTGEAITLLTICRMESSSPPGVLISISTAFACCAAAAVEPPRHVVGADRLNRVVEVDDDHARLLRLTGERPAAGQHQHTQQAVHGTD